MLSFIENAVKSNYKIYQPGCGSRVELRPNGTQIKEIIFLGVEKSEFHVSSPTYLKLIVSHCGWIEVLSSQTLLINL